MSAHALYHDYGIDFTRHVDLIMARVYYAIVDRNETHQLAHLSHNPVDFTRRSGSAPTYFWRPHLAAVFDLPAAMARQQLARAVAAPRLTAAVRALYTRIVIGHQGRPFKDISSHLFYTEDSLEWSQGSHTLHLPQQPSPAHTDRAAAARTLLQRLFLAYKGRLVVTRTKQPLRTYAVLKQHAAHAAGHSKAGYSPSALILASSMKAVLFQQRSGDLPAGAGPVWP